MDRQMIDEAMLFGETFYNNICCALERLEDMCKRINKMCSVCCEYWPDDCGYECRMLVKHDDDGSVRYFVEVTLGYDYTTFIYTIDRDGMLSLDEALIFGELAGKTYRCMRSTKPSPDLMPE